MAAPLVLFDLDGTLTDSAPGITNSVRHAVSVLGLAPLTDEALRSFVGPPLQDSFAEMGLGSAGVERAVAAYRDYFGDRGLYENEVYPGMAEVLDGLIDDGAVLVVATSKPEVYARRILEHFGLTGCFAEVVGPDLDGTGRHKHEVIAESLRRVDRAADDRAVMVGDREHDVLGARRLGIACIAVRWGYATDGELERVVPDALADDPAQLSRLLAKRWP